MIYYTGVGSRKTPPEVQKMMITYGAVFAELGYTLRSGAAQGGDAAFERGCDLRGGLKEIYLPWQGFNEHESEYYQISAEAYGAAAKIYGPRWESLSQGVHKLMARNMYQVLGRNLDTPSSFVVCWTPDGATSGKERSRITGGTGQAIECASNHLIPVFNLYNDRAEDVLLEFIGDLQHD